MGLYVLQGPPLAFSVFPFLVVIIGIKCASSLVIAFQPHLEAIAHQRLQVHIDGPSSIERLHKNLMAAIISLALEHLLDVLGGDTTQRDYRMQMGTPDRTACCD